MTRALGYAGLLPQAAAVLVPLASPLAPVALPLPHAAASLTPVFTLFYAAAILSFLGGIWWGFAMQRPLATQSSLALIAVVPSLVAVALLTAAAFNPSLALAGLGSAILLTLPVDRHLVATGEAPAGWMQLRVPLSTGLGALTILQALLTMPGLVYN